MLGLWVATLDLLYPALCPVCDAHLGAGRRDPLCGPCWGAIVRVTRPFCAVCGRPFLGWPAPPDPTPADGPAEVCAVCLAEPPPYTYARAAAVYAGTVREALHALKFHRRRTLARPLGDLLVEQCGDLPEGIDAVVPVPLGAEREAERGFNQSALVAERLAAACRLPLRPRWLGRVRATSPQSDLTAAERAANVRGAFRAAAAVSGRHVLVIDDVLTTGATVGECARALRAAGAQTVGVLAVARAL